MNIQYIQPEPDQNNPSRKVRGVNIELQRLELQIEATLKRALTLSTLLMVG